jgi:hypothetical protein
MIKFEIEREKFTMKKAGKVCLLFVAMATVITMNCASTAGGLKDFEQPAETGLLIIGDVLIENISQELSFRNWDLSTEVIIIGKSIDGTTTPYSVTTDDKGYFYLPNVPVGQYDLKAVILKPFGAQPIKLVNDLSEINSEFYRMRHPEQPVENTAKWLPPVPDGRVLNLGIIWFGLREANIQNYSGKEIGKILVIKSTEDIRSKRFYVDGFPFSRRDPGAYFEEKFPDSGWWQF